MSNNPSQNNPTINNTRELNFIDTTNELNNYSNTFPPMTSQNTTRLNYFDGHNNDSFTMNNSTFPAHPPTDNNDYHHTQPMPDNPSTSQHSQYIDPTPLQNALSLISSPNITISSPQTNIFITPISFSDMQNMQNQLQQGHNQNFLSTDNQSFPSIDNSRSQFQQ